MSSVVLITGGSRGIGAASARLAAAAGHAVCLSYVTQRDAADDVVRDIVAAGGRALAVEADVASEADVLRLFDRCADELGAPTGLVNNAGSLERQMRLDQMDAARLVRTFSVNAIGSLLCAREAVRGSSKRSCTPAAASRSASSACATRSRSGAAGNPKKWRRPSCGCSPTPRPM
jgi:NAD(P)-dependent dehydrogenase (short-subunit alcohol dehydrogenase family)